MFHEIKKEMDNKLIFAFFLYTCRYISTSVIWNVLTEYEIKRQKYTLVFNKSAHKTKYIIDLDK